MRISKQRAHENKESILQAAISLFSKYGVERVTIPQLMNEAGLTHGGFYNHFKSKDDLLRAVVAHLMNDPNNNFRFPREICRHLSRAFQGGAVNGWPSVRIGLEGALQSEAVSAAFTKGIKSHIRQLQDASFHSRLQDKRHLALTGLSTMVGAIILSETLDDVNLSDQILQTVKQQVMSWYCDRPEFV